MSFWHPKRVVPYLSKLVVDTDKDWLGYIIKNLGGIQIPRTDDPATLLEGLLWFRKDLGVWRYSPDGTKIKPLSGAVLTRVLFTANKQVTVGESASGTHTGTETTVFEDYIENLGDKMVIIGLVRAQLKLQHAPELNTYAKAIVRVYFNDTLVYSTSCTRYGGYDIRTYTKDCPFQTDPIDMSGYDEPPKVKITLQPILYNQYSGHYNYASAIIPAGTPYDFKTETGVPYILIKVS